jgi:hypothetical protein
VGCFITVIISLHFLLVVKILHLIDRTDLFKIGNLVLGGKETVTSLYSRLKRQKQRDRRPVGHVQVFV